jgi:hypothetical protein
VKPSRGLDVKDCAEVYDYEVGALTSLLLIHALVAIPCWSMLLAEFALGRLGEFKDFTLSRRAGTDA